MKYIVSNGKAKEGPPNRAESYLVEQGLPRMYAAVFEHDMQDAATPWTVTPD